MLFKEYFLGEDSNNISIVFDFADYRKHLRHGIDSLNNSALRHNREVPMPDEADINEYIEDMVKESEDNIRAGVYKDLVEAVNRMPYKGSIITIQCSGVRDSITQSYELDPLQGDSLYLNIGVKSNGLLIFKNENERMEVDDIIELDNDEEDFFDDDNTKSDYFNLVKALQNKNAFSQDRSIILYTARPQKDREYYLNQKILPVGIFLTNSLDHAQGLAIDLAGSDEPRDIYRVKVPEINLIKTLPGRIEYYQLTTQTIVPDIRLVS